MPGDFGKVLVGSGMALAGIATGNPGLVISGVSMYWSGIYGSLTGDAGAAKINLAARQQGMLLRNNAIVGAPVPVVYGTVRMGVIPIDYRVDTNSTDNKDLYIPAVVCHGSRDGYGIGGFEHVYFNEELAFTANGSSFGRFIGRAYKTDILGTDSETWSATEVDGEDLVGVTSDWDTDDDGAGLAGILFKLVYDKDVYSGIPTITVIVNGNLVEDTRDEITGTISFNTTTEVINHADVSLGQWAAGDRVEVTSGANAGVYTVESVSGDDITVVENLPSTTSYSTTIKRWAHPDNGGDNPALCIRDYLLSDVYGMGNVIASTDIDDTSFEAMANFYDESVSDGAGGTQKRFRCHGWLDVSKSVRQNIKELLSSCRGNLVFQGGKWRLFTTRSVTAETFELTEDNIIEGTWSFANAGQSTKYNISRATFPNADDNFTPDEVQWPQPGAANAYLTADNSIESRLELDLPFTKNIVTSEQITMTRVKESREGITASCVCRESALQLQIGDVVPVTHTTPAWTQKEFWVFGINPRPDFNVDVLLREYDSSAYSYDAETTASLAADTDLPDPFALGAPTDLVLAAQYRHIGNGWVLPQILVNWTDAVDTFVRHYEIQAKRMSRRQGTILIFNNADSYIGVTSPDRWEDDDYRPGDVVHVRGQSTHTYDGTYRITSLDYTNRRAYVTPAPAGTTTYSGYYSQGNPYKPFGRVNQGQQSFTINPLDVVIGTDRHRVRVVCENVLGIESMPAQNLIIYSDDFSSWQSSGPMPTLTGGQSDPDGGSDAYLVDDDNGSACEGLALGTLPADRIEFDGAGIKRFGFWIKGNTATETVVQILNNAISPTDYIEATITWAAGVPSVTVDSYNDYTGTVIEVREHDSVAGWYWIEFAVGPIAATDIIYLYFFPAGLTASNTGSVYLHRFNALDADKKITDPIYTNGAASCDVNVTSGIVEIDDTDSPYTVTDADTVIQCDVTAGSLTVNLPRAATYPRRMLTIKLVAIAAPLVLTLSAYSGDTTEVTTGLTSNGDVAVLVADAANNYWRLIGS